MSHASDLDRRFGIPGVASVVDAQGGLLAVRVASPQASGEMYLHGGHVTSWTPSGGREALFVSDQARWEAGRPIRGGVPVCFPWFGPRSGDLDAPAHGFVRTRTWALDSIVDRDGTVVVSMSTASDEAARRWWPADFHLTHRVTFGASLTLELVVQNTGTTPLEFEEALHTYYRVGNVRDVRISGLDGTRYIDTVGAREEKSQEGDIMVVSETDRIYRDVPHTIDVTDPSCGRRLRIASRHAHTAVVWNPWIARSKALADLGDDEWTEFVCIETCNVGPSAVVLAPGHQHTLRADISVETAMAFSGRV